MLPGKQATTGGRKGVRLLCRRHDLGLYWAVAVLLELLVIPLFLVTGADAAVSRGFDQAGIAWSTDIVSWVRMVVAAPYALPGFILSLVQVASPDLAVLLVVGLGFGWSGLRQVARRFRFWSPEVGWRRGLVVWAATVAVFCGMSLASGALHRLAFGPAEFQWSLHPLTLGFLGSLLVTMFLDAGALFEENGWRGFALPHLLRRHGPWMASLILGLMWTVWHLPVKFGLMLVYGVGGFALMALVLAVKFTLLCIIMTYFWRLAGGATILAIAMHGLSNDAVRLGAWSARPSGRSSAPRSTSSSPWWLWRSPSSLSTAGQMGTSRVERQRHSAESRRRP